MALCVGGSPVVQGAEMPRLHAEDNDEIMSKAGAGNGQERSSENSLCNRRCSQYCTSSWICGCARNDGQISAPARTGIRHQEREWNTYSAFYLAEPAEQF